MVDQSTNPVSFSQLDLRMGRAKRVMEIVEIFMKDDGLHGSDAVRSLQEYSAGNGVGAMRYVVGVFKQLGQTAGEGGEWEGGRKKAQEGMEFVVTESAGRYEALMGEGGAGGEEGRRIVEGCNAQGGGTG